jgi:hypothetical protein
MADPLRPDDWPDPLKKDIRRIINDFQRIVQTRCDKEAVPIVALVSVSIIEVATNRRDVARISGWTLSAKSPDVLKEKNGEHA